MNQELSISLRNRVPRRGQMPLATHFVKFQRFTCSVQKNGRARINLGRAAGRDLLDEAATHVWNPSQGSKQRALPGYYRRAGTSGRNVTNVDTLSGSETACQDVDECLSLPCSPKATCANAPGFNPKP